MAHDVKLGIGDVSGMFYHAPAGTALPTTADAALGAAWTEVGYVSQDGLSVSVNASTDSIKDWGNRTVRVIVTESEETAQSTVITTTEETLATVLGRGIPLEDEGRRRHDHRRMHQRPGHGS